MILSASQNVLHLKLTTGMVVADIGSGSVGAYAKALAARVAPSGTVYAIDVQKTVVQHLQATIGHTTPIIHPVWGDVTVAHGTSLGDTSVDAVVIANVLCQLSHIEQALNEIYRILKPGGQLLIIDFHKSFHTKGEQPLGRIVSLEDIKKFCADARLVVEDVFDAGEYHYGLVSRKVM